MNVKKVGAIAAGAAMIGAAFVAPISAQDIGGADMGFFYDSNYNPLVKIVVGTDAKASDGVAAANLAATIGNEAYRSTSTPAGNVTEEVTCPAVAGETATVLSHRAKGAIGVYEQDEDIPTEDNDDFYGSGELFGESIVEYEPGDLKNYDIACALNKSAADIPIECKSDNYQCILCFGLCAETMKNPEHTFTEKLVVDQSEIKYLEDGLGDDGAEALMMEVDSGALSYEVDIQPGILTDILRDKSFMDPTMNLVDSEYRGEIVFLGEKWLVKDIDDEEVILAKGVKLEDVTGMGFTHNFMNYSFKIESVMTDPGTQQAMGVSVAVRKPDGTVTYTTATRNKNGLVDNIEVWALSAYMAGTVARGDLVVYDVSDTVTLEDGEKVDSWNVDFEFIDSDDDSDSDYNTEDYWRSDYYPGTVDGIKMIKKIKLTYKRDKTIAVGEGIPYPHDWLTFSFEGYLDEDLYMEPRCSGGDDKIVLSTESGNDGHKVTMSFTDDDGNRYNDVRLDEGPFAINDKFLVNGIVFQFTDDDVSGDEVELTFKDLYNDKEYTVLLNQVASGTSTIYFARETYDSCSQDEDDYIEMDDERYVGEPEDESGRVIDELWGVDDVIPMMYFREGEDLIFDYDQAVDDDQVPGEDEKLDGTTIGVNPIQIGNASDKAFKDFARDDNVLRMWVERENGTNKNGDGDDFDTLFVFESDCGEKVYVDFYDDHCDENEDCNESSLYYGASNYWNSTDNGTFNQRTGPTCGEAAASGERDHFSGGILADESGGDGLIRDDEDTLLWEKEGGDLFEVTSWSTGDENDRVETIEICHPDVCVLPTYFLGQEERDIMVSREITAADIGEEISFGCCVFTVENFTVVGGEAGAGPLTKECTVSCPDSVQMTANAVSKTMVVTDAGGAPGGNVIAVGGPVVNTVTQNAGVSKDQVCATGTKIEKKGSVLVVAGCEAADTTSAVNQVIDFIKNNAH